jgi:hypothetical protein
LNEDPLYQLNLNWEQISNSKRTQLLKTMPLIAAADYSTARNAIAGLKVEKAVQAQLLGLLAARISRNEPESGMALFDEAIAESLSCWWKTDRIRALGFILQQLAQSHYRPKARALLKQVDTLCAGFQESALSNQAEIDSIINCLADLGVNLLRCGFGWPATRYFKMALHWSERFHDPEPARNFEARTAAYSRIAKKWAAGGQFCRALRIAKSIQSQTFNGLEYCNRESLRAQTLQYIGIQLARNGQRRRGGRVLSLAARIVIADVHDFDRSRSDNLLRISMSLEEIGLIKQARAFLTKASQIAAGAP